MVQANSNQVIYFEKQGQDMLCGLHCINALLQGPSFDEVSLSQIAIQLDQEERQLLSGESASFFGESANVANDGNYSIQVLSKALQQFGNIQTTPIGSSSVGTRDMSSEQGFIAHKGNHWIAIRKVANVWYNLNSTNIVPPGPQFISDFQLDAFLSSIANSGFTIYIVKAAQGQQLPLPNPA